MQYDFKEDRLYIQRTSAEKEPLLQRLNRVEGQVRGLRQMIENDRYCGDEVQQASAITAAVREVALLVISQHLEVGVNFAAENDTRKPAVDEMIGLLRIAMRQQ
jgi:DNA-binding FrmR family transcriptional regulator